MGEAEFNQAYQKNLNRTRKVKAKDRRKVDPDLREDIWQVKLNEEEDEE